MQIQSYPASTVASLRGELEQKQFRSTVLSMNNKGAIANQIDMKLTAQKFTEGSTAVYNDLSDVNNTQNYLSRKVPTLPVNTLNAFKKQRKTAFSSLGGNQQVVATQSISPVRSMEQISVRDPNISVDSSRNQSQSLINAQRKIQQNNSQEQGFL